MKYKIIVSVVYFVILYLIAYFSARGYRDDDCVLGVNRSQWSALFMMWLPVLVIFGK